MKYLPLIIILLITACTQSTTSTEQNNQMQIDGKAYNVNQYGEWGGMQMLTTEGVTVSDTLNQYGGKTFKVKGNGYWIYTDAEHGSHNLDDVNVRLVHVDDDKQIANSKIVDGNINFAESVMILQGTTESGQIVDVNYE